MCWGRKRRRAVCYSRGRGLAHENARRSLVWFVSIVPTPSSAHKGTLGFAFRPAQTYPKNLPLKQRTNKRTNEQCRADKITPFPRTTSHRESTPTPAGNFSQTERLRVQRSSCPQALSHRQQHGQRLTDQCPRTASHKQRRSALQYRPHSTNCDDVL